MAKAIVKTHSSDGDIHLIFCELKLDQPFTNQIELNKNQIREIMKEEARKPLRFKHQ